jgi:hypothetical protein
VPLSAPKCLTTAASASSRSAEDWTMCEMFTLLSPSVPCDLHSIHTNAGSRACRRERLGGCFRPAIDGWREHLSFL